MAKLNQIIAIEKGIKSASYSAVGELHKANKKADLFNGFSKTYEKISEDGEDLPAESKRVQFNVNDVLHSTQTQSTDLFNITARKDYTNCVAKADVVVGGITVLKDAPVSYLLFLEKQLTDLRTFADGLPVLDSAEDWTLDSNSGLYKAAPTKTHRTKKLQKPIVLYNATPEHPAQTQLITEDVLVGYWTQVKQSGAMPAPRRDAILTKIEGLLRAVKQAREAANNTEEVSVADIGTAVFDYLLA